MDKFLLHATCGTGMETMLKREVKMLGFEEAAADAGYVSFLADEKEILRANLYLRTAERVLLKLMEFGASDFDTLFDKVSSFPWGKFLPQDAKFFVAKISSVNSALFAKRDCQRVIKKAIVERLKKDLGISGLKEDGEKYEIFVKIRNDRVQLFFNTSGEGLHKRGYRPAYGEAPLRETLAAGMVLLAGYKRSKYLIDPMCGSGTIPIEAAMFAANIPVGLCRSFDCEKWGLLSKRDIEKIRQEAKDNILHPETAIYGYDIDEEVLELAKENAKRAGVEDLVKFKTADIATFASPTENGILVSNPPYGERMKPEDLRTFYRTLGKMLCRLKNFRALIICGAENFEDMLGYRADKLRKTSNSNIEAKLYIFEDTKNMRKIKDQRKNEDKRSFGGSSKTPKGK